VNHSEWEGEKTARKSRQTEEQVAPALQQHQAGIPVHEIIRKYGISQEAFYRRRNHKHCPHAGR